MNFNRLFSSLKKANIFNLSLPWGNKLPLNAAMHFRVFKSRKAKPALLLMHFNSSILHVIWAVKWPKSSFLRWNNSPWWINLERSQLFFEPQRQGLTCVNVPERDYLLAPLPLERHSDLQQYSDDPCEVDITHDLRTDRNQFQSVLAKWSE